MAAREKVLDYPFDVVEMPIPESLVAAQIVTSTSRTVTAMTIQSRSRGRTPRSRSTQFILDKDR